MRAGEYINLVCFVFLIGLAWVRPLPPHRRTRTVLMGILGVTLIAAAIAGAHVLPPVAGSVVRDWIPALLLLMVYWQAGQFFLQPIEVLQHRLLQLDQRFLHPVVSMLGRARLGRWVTAYLELSYLLCYALVPMGVVTLYLLHHRNYVDTFWLIVLPPTCLCYLMVPFLQTLPPRALGKGVQPSPKSGKVRDLNLWVLRYGSIQANTLPSAHVAASVATALALFFPAPAVAPLFLWGALSIACGAAVGRYHYLADVVLGIVLAITAASFSIFF